MEFLEDLKKPFNLVNFILAILGIILSIIFFYKAEREKSISYNINETSSLIYDSKNSVSTIKIYDKNSVSINENVYLINGTVWNSGDFPINKNDVRIPISINLNNGCKIIDFKITKEKEKSISKFSVTHKSTNSLNLDWNYFDPSFGFKFQIIYVSSEPSEIKLKGKILDINEFNKVKKMNHDTSSMLILMLWIFIGYISIKFVNYLYHKILKLNKESKFTNISQFLITAFLITIFIYLTLPLFKQFIDSTPNF